MESNRNGASANGAGDESVRVIRPAVGATIDDRQLSLRNVHDLARALVDHTEGRLDELRRAAEEVEARIRLRTSECKRRIEQAVALSRQLVGERLREADGKVARACEESAARGYEEGRTSGFRSGYEEGLASGLQEGRASGARAARDEFSQESAGLSAAIESIAAQLETRWTELLADARGNLIHLALRAAQKIIRAHVEVVPDAVRANLAAAIDRLADNGCLTIEMNAADVEIMSAELETLQRGLDRNAALRLVPSERMARGGCVLEGGSGRVDLSIETQVEVLAARCREAEEVGA